MGGGIRITENGDTNFKGMFAAGELSGGVHEANRMGGNAMVEIIVFGARAGAAAAAYAKNVSHKAHSNDTEQEYGRLTGCFSNRGVTPQSVIENIRETMAEYVGVARHKDGLLTAMGKIKAIREKVCIKWLTNIAGLYSIRILKMAFENAGLIRTINLNFL